MTDNQPTSIPAADDVTSLELETMITKTPIPESVVQAVPPAAPQVMMTKELTATPMLTEYGEESATKKETTVDAQTADDSKVVELSTLNDDSNRIVDEELELDYKEDKGDEKRKEDLYQKDPKQWVTKMYEDCDAQIELLRMKMEMQMEMHRKEIDAKMEMHRKNKQEIVNKLMEKQEDMANEHNILAEQQNNDKNMLLAESIAQQNALEEVKALALHTKASTTFNDTRLNAVEKKLEDFSNIAKSAQRTASKALALQSGESLTPPTSSMQNQTKTVQPQQPPPPPPTPPDPPPVERKSADGGSGGNGGDGDSGDEDDAEKQPKRKPNHKKTGDDNSTEDITSSPFFSLVMSHGDIDHSWWDPNKPSLTKEAIRTINVMTSKTQPNLMEFLKNKESYYKKNENLQTQLQGFFKAITNSTLTQAVVQYRSYAAYLAESNSIHEELDKWFAKYKANNPNFHNENGRTDIHLYDGQSFHRVGEKCLSQANAFYQKISAAVKKVPSKNSHSPQFSDLTKTFLEFRRADEQVFNWMYNWILKSLENDNPITEEILSQITKTTCHTHALIAFLTRDNPSTNDHQLNVLRGRLHNVRFTAEDAVHHVSHYIGYLSEIVRDINQRLLTSDEKVDEKTVFNKTVLELKSAYEMFAEQVPITDMSRHQQQTVSDLRKELVNGTKATNNPPWGSSLQELVQYHRNLETTLSSPRNPPSKWIHKWTSDGGHLELPNGPDADEINHFNQDLYGNQLYQFDEQTYEADDAQNDYETDYMHPEETMQDSCNEPEIYYYNRNQTPRPNPNFRRTFGYWDNNAQKDQARKYEQRSSQWSANVPRQMRHTAGGYRPSHQNNANRTSNYHQQPWQSRSQPRGSPYTQINQGYQKDARQQHQWQQRPRTFGIHYPRGPPMYQQPHNQHPPRPTWQQNQQQQRQQRDSFHPRYNNNPPPKISKAHVQAMQLIKQKLDAGEKDAALDVFEKEFAIFRRYHPQLFTGPDGHPPANRLQPIERAVAECNMFLFNAQNLIDAHNIEIDDNEDPAFTDYEQHMLSLNLEDNTQFIPQEELSTTAMQALLNRECRTCPLLTVVVVVV